MSNKESLTLKEKLYRLAAVGALGSVALTGCAANVDATPSLTSTSQSETPSTPSASPTETTPKPSPSETETPSGIIVDYASFANWDTITSGSNPVYEHQREGSREYICDTFFATNGLANPEFRNDEQSWSGSEIMSYAKPRLDLIWQLNLDTSNPVNETVSKHLLECLTSSKESDAYTELSNSLDTARESSLEITSPLTDMSNVTRESAGTWNNGTGNMFVVEYGTTNGIGDKVFPKFTFEWTPSNDFRINTIDNLTAGDDTIVWGTRAPIVTDQSRATTPYELQ